MLPIKPVHFSGGRALISRSGDHASLQELLEDAQSSITSVEETANTALEAANQALDGLEGIGYSVGDSGDVLVSNGSTYVPVAVSSLLTNRTTPQLMDCLTDPAVSGWGRALSGTGSVSAISGSSSDHPGQWRLVVGGGTSSRAALHFGPATGGPVTPDSSMVGFFEVMIKLPTLSGVGNTFEVSVGMLDNASASSASNGVYFYVDSSAQLYAKSITANVVGSNTSIAAMTANVWYRLRATFVGTNVVLSWAQTEDRAAALTTALTVAKIAQPQGPQVKIARLTGTTARELNLDYLTWYLPKV